MALGEWDVAREERKVAFGKQKVALAKRKVALGDMKSAAFRETKRTAFEAHCRRANKKRSCLPEKQEDSSAMVCRHVWHGRLT